MTALLSTTIVENGPLTEGGALLARESHLLIESQRASASSALSGTMPPCVIDQNLPH